MGARPVDRSRELRRTFVIRIKEGTAAGLTPALVRRFAAGAPNAQQWHGRMDHDPAHKWLREQVREASVWLDSADVLYSRSHATAEYRNGDTVTVAASAAVHRSSRSASAWFLG
ncbi:hypothetical protein F6X56_26090 [Rhodococcus erythropolis]|nr:hypothetical protein F6X56_26090 [Rhodococcus erythropolis]